MIRTPTAIQTIAVILVNQYEFSAPQGRMLGR